MNEIGPKFIFISILILFLSPSAALRKSGTDQSQSGYVEIPDTSVIIQKLGIILQQQEYMGMDTNDRMISFFIKLHKPNPSLNNSLSCALKANIAINENDAINASMLQYQTIFEQLVRVNVTPRNTSSPRSKRSILGFF
jgi:hypothetical protein